MTTYSKTHLRNIDPPDLGRALQGVGLNLLVKNAKDYSAQLHDVLGVEVIRAEDAFALIAAPLYGPPSDDIAVHHLVQIHADFTYHNNPFKDHLPEHGPRGLGVELHFFETDPDDIAARATSHDDWIVLQQPMDKPHGVRECYLLDGHGYCWVVSSPLSSA